MQSIGVRGPFGAPPPKGVGIAKKSISLGKSGLNRHHLPTHPQPPLPPKGAKGGLLRGVGRKLAFAPPGTKSRGGAKKVFVKNFLKRAVLRRPYFFKIFIKKLYRNRHVVIKKGRLSKYNEDLETSHKIF